MNMKNYLVSVILSVYNGEKYLEEAIESLLAQTYTPIEIIIVNDGSIDRTEEVIAKYREVVRYLYQTNRGQPAATNLGISMAKGEYIAFLDADDLYLPDKTETQLQFLQHRPDMDCVFGMVEQFYSPELSIEARTKWVCPSQIFPGYLAAAGLFRRECFEKIGLFNEKQRIGVFIDWYMRACEKGLHHFLIETQVLKRRIHDNNMGIYSKNSRHEYVQIVKEALKRRTHELQPK
jgi:glycosyltransferase involved in cell wall biosynthesis